MRVPHNSAPLVSIPGGDPGSIGNRQHSLSMGTPMEAANASAAAQGGNSWLAPVASGMADVAKMTAIIGREVMQKKAETEASNAYAALTQESNDFLYNAQGGIFSRQGTNALSSVEDTRKFYEKSVQRLSKGMNSAAAEAFEKMAFRSRVTTQSAVAQHVGRQLEHAQFNAVKSGMIADHSSALLGYNNDRLFNDNLAQVRAGAERLAQLNGWDPETTAQYVQKATTETMLGRVQRFTDAQDFDRAFEVWQQADMSANDRFKSGQELSRAYFNALVAEAKADPAGMLENMRARGWDMMGGKGASFNGDVASFVAGFESGKDGGSAIGYDPNGGTSYGKFQLSSREGSIDRFMSWLDDRGHAEAASALRASGDANTGGKTGAMPEAWKKLVADGAITDAMQEQFIKETHVAPAMRGQRADFAAAVEADPRLAAAVFSTAVQHGPGGAQKLMARAWDGSDGDAVTFIKSLYEDRKKQLASSPPEVQKAVAERLDREMNALLHGGGFAATAAANAKTANPETLEDLFNMADKRSLWQTAKSELYKVDAEKKREASTIMHSSKNELEFAMAKGDFSRVEAMEKKLNQLGFTQQADDLYKIRTVHEGAAQALGDAQSLPFIDQAEQMREYFDGIFSPDNAALVNNVREAYQRRLQASVDAFQKDPAAVAAKVLRGRQGNTAQQQQADQQITLEQAARQNMAVQQSLAEGLPGFSPRVLPAEQVKIFNAELERADVDAGSKLDRITALAQGFGSLAGNVFTELKLPPGAVAAAALVRDDPTAVGLARQLLTAALTPEKDMPSGGELTPGEVKDLLSKNDALIHAELTTSVMPGNADVIRQYSGLQDAAGKMVRLYGKTSLEGLAAPYTYIRNKNAVLRLPKTGLDTTAVEYGLADLHRNVKNLLPEGVPERAVDKLRRFGVWISAGNSAVLMYEGRAVPHRDGGIISIPYADAARMWKEAVTNSTLNVVGDI